MLEKLLSVFAGDVVGFRTWVVLFWEKLRKRNARNHQRRRICTCKQQHVQIHFRSIRNFALKDAMQREKERSAQNQAPYRRASWDIKGRTPNAFCSVLCFWNNCSKLERLWVLFCYAWKNCSVFGQRCFLARCNDCSVELSQLLVLHLPVLLRWHFFIFLCIKK